MAQTLTIVRIRLDSRLSLVVARYFYLFHLDGHFQLHDLVFTDLVRLFHLLERNRPLLPILWLRLSARVVSTFAVPSQLLYVPNGLRLGPRRDWWLRGQNLLCLLPLRDMLHHKRVRGHYVKYFSRAVQVVNVLVCLVVLSPLLGLGLC